MIEDLYNAFPSIIYLIPISLLLIAFLAVAILAYSDTRKVRREARERQKTTEQLVDDSVHYVERIVRDKYITTCNRQLDLDCRNVTNLIPKTTCIECLKKIT